MDVTKPVKFSVKVDSFVHFHTSCTYRNPQRIDVVVINDNCIDSYINV